MYTYDDNDASTLEGLFASDVAIVERARRQLAISQTVAGVVRYGSPSIVAMIYFYDDREVYDLAVSDPSSNDWSTADVVVRMDRTGACFLEA